MSDKRLRVDLEPFRRRYWVSNRQGKSKLLSELVDLYGYNRKYLIQAMNDIEEKVPKKRGKRRRYGDDVIEPLKRIWLATDQMCSKRLKAAMVLWLPYYDGALSERVRKQLLKLSAASIDRLLKPYRVQYKRHGLCGTKPGYLLKNQIPIKTDNWDVCQPGFVEADTVAHCGNSMSGDFVWSLTLTDIATGWTENGATWNKGSEGVIEQIKVIEKRLPFGLKGFDCDNGSEFLNWHLVRYFTEEKTPTVAMTRSRPYKKNDNAHVEQKNWSHVRHLLGYDRFDNPQAVPLINALYANEWSLYQNFFMPSQKLKSKERINSKYRKRYEPAKTAYQRIMEAETVADETKQRLSTLFSELNPFALRKGIEQKLKHIFRYVKINKKPRTKL